MKSRFKSNIKLALVMSLLAFAAIIFFLAYNVYATNSVKTYADGQSRAKTQKVIKVAYNIQEQLTDFDENGNHVGYTYEYLNKIAQFTGWSYEFVPIVGKDTSESISMAMEMVKNGEVDLIGSLLKNEYLESTYEYPQKNYGVVYDELLVTDDETELNETNYMLRSPLRIAVLENATTRNAELEKFLQNGDIEHELIVCKTGEEQYNALKHGTADAMMGLTLSPTKGTKQLANFSPRPFYFAVTKGNTEIVDGIDDAIAKIEETDPHYTNRLFEKYFGDSEKEFRLSSEEEAYIAEKKVIKVLAMPELAPFAFLNSKGELCGISKSILESISESTNLEINYTILQDKTRLSQELASGKYDLIFGMNNDEAIATQYGLVLSRSYLDVGISCFYNVNSPLDKPQEDSTLAISVGARMLSSVKYKEIVRYSTVEECMKAVERGEADFGYANSYSVDFYIMRDNFTSLQPIPVTGEYKTISFAITDPDNTQLLKIINKQVSALSNKHIDSYLLQAVDGLGKGTVTEFVKANMALTATIILALFLCVVAVIFLAGVSSINKKKNHQLQEAYSEAKRANNAKTEFLSRMSHEMRTPLSAVIGMTGIARTDSGNKIIVEDSLDKIDVASNHLLNLINDVLDMSKINEGKLKIQESPFDFVDMIRSIEVVYDEYAKGKNIRMKLSIDKNISRYLQGDELRIKQIIINLLSNGIKYNVEGGSINIDITLLKEDKSEQTLRISVSDTGIGIVESRRREIFEAFEREAFADKTAIEGTGLGLSISQKLARLMGSNINIESQVDSGSRFYLDLTLKKAKRPASTEDSAEHPAIDLAGQSFMVVDDNDINVLILERMLTSLGARVEVACNGKEAVEKLAQSEDGQYAAIFMDIRMPILDGYEATRQIRAMARNDADTIIIVAVSANAFSEDVEKSLACGMNSHLAKPVEIGKLYRILEDM